MTTTKATGAVTEERTLINENTHSQMHQYDDHDDGDDDDKWPGARPQNHTKP